MSELQKLENELKAHFGKWNVFLVNSEGLDDAVKVELATQILNGPAIGVAEAHAAYLRLHGEKNLPLDEFLRQERQ